MFRPESLQCSPQAGREEVAAWEQERPVVSDGNAGGGGHFSSLPFWLWGALRTWREFDFSFFCRAVFPVYWSYV